MPTRVACQDASHDQNPRLGPHKRLYRRKIHGPTWQECAPTRVQSSSNLRNLEGQCGGPGRQSRSILSIHHPPLNDETTVMNGVRKSRIMPSYVIGVHDETNPYLFLPVSKIPKQLFHPVSLTNNDNCFLLHLFHQLVPIVLIVSTRLFPKVLSSL